MLTQSRLAQACGGTAALLLVLAATALVACAPRRLEPSAPPEAGPAATVRVPRGARVFEVDPARSTVSLRVYRAGPLARLGHDHVITSATLDGRAWTTGALASSGFDLRLPVASLVVDDPAARRAAGPGFEKEVPPQAREGTRGNLLRPEVLDAGRYPEIRVQAASLGGTWEAPVARADVTLRDRTRRLEIPLTLTRGAGELAANGSFRLRQTDFGIAPFSVAGGAIQVADDVDIAFEIHASEVPARAP
jgi:polyisoprenoid-binding protein YceI